MIITIDGPTASGKSTAARMLAQKLGLCHLNSGFLFRAIAYQLFKDTSMTPEMVAGMSVDRLQEYLAPERFAYRYTAEHGAQVVIDGVDVTAALKTPDIDTQTSLISSFPHVRVVVLRFQREMAEHCDMIVDGRDTGSVVFPDATIKFYITASLAERATRWYLDQKRKGIEITLEQAKQLVADRDMRDTTREDAPLIIPEGAFVIDNSGYGASETLDMMLAQVAKVRTAA